MNADDKPVLPFFAGMPWTRGRARKETVCCISGRRITTTEHCWRPVTNNKKRWWRMSDEEMERLGNERW